MKKLVLAFSLVVGGLAVYAQDTTSTTTPRQQQYPTTNSSSTMGQGQDDQDREKISSRDLPDAVKRSLEGTEYRGWLVNAAYKSKGVNGTTSNDSTSSSTSGQTTQSNDSTSVSGNTSGNTSGAYGQEVYVVELKNGAQTKTIRFDKDGNKLDDQGGMKKDDQK